MHRKDLRDIIRSGESSTVEFKRKFTTSEKIAREMIAFANTKGGFLIIGVDDDGSIVGVKSEKEQVAQLEHAVLSIVPPLDIQIEILEVDSQDIVIVEVPNSPLRPHRYISDDPAEKPHERKAFIRQGESSVAASKEMTKILSGQRDTAPPMTLSIGDRERRLFTYLEAHGRATIHDFARLVNISKRRAAQIMVKLVRAGVVHINTNGDSDYYTLV
ncbi:MAG: ATP-binding protein [Candidatus Kapabacteria bacterium]|nr:ATP-binding protein [Candidatus Kapabacteria bacterium]